MFAPAPSSPSARSCSTPPKCRRIPSSVYRGADGNFVFYEDENDTYDYETGALATVTFAWSEANQMLAVGARQGSFPGMLDQRTFRIVFVGPNHGRGAAETATAEQVVTYSGAALSIRAP